MLLLLLQQQQQQVVNHQHMVFSVCCLFASLVSFFSFSFIERERHDTIQCKPFFLPTRDLSIALSLSHSLSFSYVVVWEDEREREDEREELLSSNDLVFLLLLRLLLDDDDVLVVSTTTPTTRSSERREREQWVQESDLSLLVLLLVLVFGTFLWLIRPTHCLLPCWLGGVVSLRDFPIVTDFLLCLKCCCSWVIACFQFRIIALCSPTQLISPWRSPLGRCLMCSSRWWQAQRLALGMSMHGPMHGQAMTWIKYPRGGDGIGQQRQRHVRLCRLDVIATHRERERERERESRSRWWLVTMACEYSTPSSSSPTSTIIIMMEMMINSSTTSTTITSRIMSQLLVDGEREREKADQVDD